MAAQTGPNFDTSILFDAIIIGAGPAGLSAALALCRMKRPAVVFSDGEFRNAKAHLAHTILSRDDQPASEIRKIGREQIERYGTTRFVERRVCKARKDGNDFEVEDDQGEKWRAKKIVLAMGVRDAFPDLEGYADCWGQSIYQCLFCDGLERADRPAAMLGFDSPMSLHFIGIMFHIGCPIVTILSNGPLKPLDEATAEALKVAEASGAKVDERRIRKLVHHEDEQGIDVVFEDGDSFRIGFLQHTPPTHVVAPNLAEDLGVEKLPDGRGGTLLKTSQPFGETNLEGVFVTGDAGVVMKHFANAMALGVAAGAGVSFQLGKEEERELAKNLVETNV